MRKKTNILSLTIITIIMSSCTLQKVTAPTSTNFNKPENKALLAQYVTTLNNAKLGFVPYNSDAASGSIENSTNADGTLKDFTPINTIPENGSLNIMGITAELHFLEFINVNHYRAIYKIDGTYAGFAYKPVMGTNIVVGIPPSITEEEKPMLVQINLFSYGFDSSLWNQQPLIPYAWDKHFIPSTKEFAFSSIE